VIVALDAFGVMNVVGLLALAVVGSLRGVDADLDLLDVVALATVTGVGGGWSATFSSSACRSSSWRASTPPAR
jgi:uncharacterized membrane protein YeiH